MLSAEERDKVKKEILEKLEHVKSRVESLSELSKPVAPDNAIGRITRMDAIQQKSVNERHLRTAEETILKLEEALLAVDSSGFGLCSRCQTPIPFNRLMALPESRSCVTCAGRLF